jgi:hypothetical protein
MADNSFNIKFLDELMKDKAMKNTQQAENQQIDRAIYALDAVMNGGVDAGVEVPAFMPECLDEMRLIMRNLLTALSAPAVVA